ncbi:MAG TPA: acyl-CoA dehydrogenase family protein [Stellaceae bacterium]|nr:acyl-CoA dehydrogenase family protein [Stellaceae bacterium]
MTPPRENSAPVPTPAELIARARSFIPKLIECTAETDRERRVPHRVVDEMRAAGLFRALQPKRWGGYEMDVGSYYEIEMALGEGDMSAAWVYGVVGVTQWVMALLDDRAARDVWGADSSALVALSLAPAGKIVPVESGFRLSGRWPFASGCLYCDWALVGAFVPPDSPAGADTPPEWRMYLVPKADYTIADVWHTSGLKGTGSNDIVVKDAFVPAYRMHLMTGNIACSGPGQAVNTSPLYRIPFGQVFGGGVAYAAIGALQGMLDEFRAYAGPRMRLGGRKTVDDPDALLAVGDADHAIDEMKTLLHRNVRNLTAYAERGDVPPPAERLKYKFQMATATERCRALAVRLFQVAGAAGLYAQHRFGRILADINAGRQHVTNQHEMHGREWGRYLLGQPIHDDVMR